MAESDLLKRLGRRAHCAEVKTRMMRHNIAKTRERYLEEKKKINSYTGVAELIEQGGVGTVRYIDKTSRNMLVEIEQLKESALAKADVLTTRMKIEEAHHQCFSSKERAYRNEIGRREASLKLEREDELIEELLPRIRTEEIDVCQTSNREMASTRGESCWGTVPQAISPLTSPKAPVESAQGRGSQLHNTKEGSEGSVTEHEVNVRTAQGTLTVELMKDDARKAQQGNDVALSSASSQLFTSLKRQGVMLKEQLQSVGVSRVYLKKRDNRENT